MTEWIQGSAHVPEISDELLANLTLRFAPLVMEEGGLYKIEPVDPRKTAFTWSPQTVGEPVSFREIVRVNTDHYCRFPGFFKPSIAEVLAQLPDGWEKCNAFYIDTDSVKIYGRGNGHRAVTIFGRIGEE